MLGLLARVELAMLAQASDCCKFPAVMSSANKADVCLMVFAAKVRKPDWVELLVSGYWSAARMRCPEALKQASARSTQLEHGNLPLPVRKM